MKIEVLNLNRKRRIDARACRALAAFCMRCAMAGGAERFTRLTVVLAGDAVMRACKRTLFGKDAVTDVISLAYDPVPGEADGRTADVYINTERAAQESAARERPARRAAGGITAEFALYLAHGIDHLTGGRDETPAGRRGMRRRELRWLNLARRQGLMDGPP